MSNAITPVEALESAVAHHKEEMAPSLVARHTTLTLLRRVATVALGVGVIVAGLLVGERLSPVPNIEGCVAVGGTVFTWVAGMSLLSSLTRVARRAIAGSTLRSFESTQGVNALGASGAGASVGVSALLTPAQKMLQLQERAARERVDIARARKEARDRAKGAAGDHDARDFDDA